MKNKIIAIICASTLTFSACKDSFFDINKNPNLPTEEAITPDLLMTSVITNVVKRSTSSYRFSAHWMGYWARGSSFGISVPLENYNIDAAFEATQWSGITPDAGWYDILMDNHVMEQKATVSGEQFYVGVAKALKTVGFMYLVDMYNNVPYSEAFNLAKNITPKYDKGEDIYKDLLIQLDEARKIFANSNLSVSDQAVAADLVFKGDLKKWRKFVNTQTLKLLIHQSEKVTNPSAEIAKIVADGSGFLDEGETAWVNPGYSNDKYKLNPMYIAYVRDENNTLVDGFNRANNFVLDKYKQNDDLRYQQIFLKAITPVGGELWRGKNFGQNNVQGESSSGESIVMGLGLVPSPDAPAWLFTSVESLFLQAEAVQRGWLSGNAESIYERAVEESFVFLKVPDAQTEVAGYLQKNIASWANNSNKLELIVNQKYLALPGINNFEAWVDYRRLGYPSDVPLSLNSSLNGRKIPLRLQYPQNEFNYNAANVAAEGDIDPQKDKIWWDVN